MASSDASRDYRSDIPCWFYNHSKTGCLRNDCPYFHDPSIVRGVKSTPCYPAANTTAPSFPAPIIEESKVDDESDVRIYWRNCPDVYGIVELITCVVKEYGDDNPKRVHVLPSKVTSHSSPMLSGFVHMIGRLAAEDAVEALCKTDVDGVFIKAHIETVNVKQQSVKSDDAFVPVSEKRNAIKRVIKLKVFFLFFMLFFFFLLVLVCPCLPLRVLLYVQLNTFCQDMCSPTSVFQAWGDCGDTDDEEELLPLSWD